MRRADELRVVRILLDLPPKSSDGEIDGSRDDVVVEISPYGAEQFVAVHHDIAAIGKIAQQLELAMRQRNRPPSIRCVLFEEVNRDRSQSYPADGGP